MAKYALLIGVSEYRSDLQPIPAAVNDIEAMRRVLADPEMGDFDDIKVLANPASQEMREEIEIFFEGRTRDDLVVLFFSGHGIRDDKRRLYFATPNTEKRPNGVLKSSSAVDANEVRRWMNECRAKRQVVILDCCFSGAFVDPDFMLKDDGSVDLQEQFLGNEEDLGSTGRVALASSSNVQFSFAQVGSELSLYTRYLVEGISTGAGDTNGDGWVSIEELHNYASSRVQETTPDAAPKMIHLKDDGYKINLSKARVEDPLLKYRKSASQVAEAGTISPASRILLNTLQEQLRITESDAATIESEVLRPYQERLANLQRYREALIAEAEHEYPLTSSGQASLKQLRQLLGLRDKDILPIEQEIEKQFGHSAEQLQEFQEDLVVNEEQSQDWEDLVEEAFSSRDNWREKFIKEADSTMENLHKLVGGKPGERVSLQQNMQLIRLGRTEVDIETVEITGIEKGLFGMGQPKVITQLNHSRVEVCPEDLGQGVELKLVRIPAGKFAMGSTEDSRFMNESPVHTVKIPTFLMGCFAVTQAQWQIVTRLPLVKQYLEPDPFSILYGIDHDIKLLRGDNYPVQFVNWFEAVEFCSRLSQLTGRIYRIPSEAEWEYSCRAGTTTPFYFGETITTDLANYNGEDYALKGGGSQQGYYGRGPRGQYRGQITEVGQFPPNAFGLYDMHGNVFEWCLDHSHDNYEHAPKDGTAWLSDDEDTNRIVRGGHWEIPPIFCRSAYRHNCDPYSRIAQIGFRVVCEL